MTAAFRASAIETRSSAWTGRLDSVKSRQSDKAAIRLRPRTAEIDEGIEIITVFLIGAGLMRSSGVKCHIGGGKVSISENYPQFFPAINARRTDMEWEGQLAEDARPVARFDRRRLYEQHEHTE